MCNPRAVLVWSWSYFCLLGSLSPPTSKAGQGEGRLWSEEGTHTIYFSHPAIQPDISGGCSSEHITRMELLHYSTDAQNTGQGPSFFLNQIKKFILIYCIPLVVELIFFIVSCTVLYFGCVTKPALPADCAQQCLHSAKASSAPHPDTQWGVGCGQGAGGGTAGTVGLRDSLCYTRSCSALKTGDGEGGCSRSLLLEGCLGINWLVAIAFSLLVFHGFIFIFSPFIY